MANAGVQLVGLIPTCYLGRGNQLPLPLPVPHPAENHGGVWKRVYDLGAVRAGAGAPSPRGGGLHACIALS